MATATPELETKSLPANAYQPLKEGELYVPLVPTGMSPVPHLRVPTLDANLGSLTLTTGVTSSLDPAIYNACGWVGGPGYHPLPPLKGCLMRDPHALGSVTRPTLARCRMGWVSLKSASSFGCLFSSRNRFNTAGIGVASPRS